jgi:hypothetical protein
MRSLLLRGLPALAGAALLVIVFAGYLRPTFIVDLANRIWLCL